LSIMEYQTTILTEPDLSGDDPEGFGASGGAERVSLPTNLPKRGLSKGKAAEYCGVSLNTLERHDPTPTKIGGRTIDDRRVLDRWVMDRRVLGCRLNQVAGSISLSDGEDGFFRGLTKRRYAVRKCRGRPDD
jgi:hypothetical protein